MRTDSLRFPRVALWGASASLLFLVLFQYLFRLFLNRLIEVRSASDWLLPGPAPPSVAAGVMVLFLIFAALVLFWKVQISRRPDPRSDFISHKGNGKLILQLLFLMVLLAAEASVPQHTTLTTCRCCLFSVEPACGTASEMRLPVEGFYHLDSPVGEFFGLYPRGSRGTREAGKFQIDGLTFSNVRAERTRFGWPLRAITRDAVPLESEWHIVVEGWFYANLASGFWSGSCFRRRSL